MVVALIETVIAVETAVTGAVEVAKVTFECCALAPVRVADVVLIPMRRKFPLVKVIDKRDSA